MSKSTPKLILLQTTVSSNRDAQRLAKQLITERHAACVQTIPIHSTYRWKGRIESAKEILLMIKTRAPQARALIRWLERHHPYETPEIVVCPIQTGSIAYQKWVFQETQAPRLQPSILEPLNR